MIRLALGAGHGINTSGKRCLKSIDPNETREWFLNDRICDIVEKLLSEYEGIQICRLDDTTGQVDVSLETRKKKAESFGADIYISVHHNAGINGGNGGGTIVYCYQTATNKSRAQRIYDAIVAQTGLVGNRSTKIGDGNKLYECYSPSMPSYIIENGFMDSTTDTPIILSESHARKTAQGIVNFLVSEYGLTRKAVEPEKPSMLFVPVSELAYEEVVEIDNGIIKSLADRYGKTVEWILSNNPGIYRIDSEHYLVNKETSIYVG